MLLEGSSPLLECFQKTTRQRQVATGLTLCSIHERLILLVVKSCNQHTAHNILYLKIKDALREIAANLAHIDNPNPYSDAI
jgi:hypothetical protein